MLKQNINILDTESSLESNDNNLKNTDELSSSENIEKLRQKLLKLNDDKFIKNKSVISTTKINI